MVYAKQLALSGLCTSALIHSNQAFTQPSEKLGKINPVKSQGFAKAPLSIARLAEPKKQGLTNLFASSKSDGDQDKLLDALIDQKNTTGAINATTTKNDFPLPGIGITVPLNLIAGIFNVLRYGELTLGPEDAALQACLGYLTYGTDRLLDAITESDDPDHAKQALYENIKKNAVPMLAAISASSAYAFHTLMKEDVTKPFIPLLASTFFYKNLKENVGELKPFYIATMWTAACVILPAVMHDKDFSILSRPEDYLPAALLMFGSTNLADTADIEEDTKKQIQTLPVKLGKPTADVISALSLFAATGLLLDKIGHLIN